MTEARRLFKRRLLAGLVVIAPVGVTIWVLWWIFRLTDGILGQFLQGALGVRIPGLGLVLLVLILFAVGWLAEATVGTRILDGWHRFLDRVPLVSRLYGATRRIAGSVFGGQENRFFREVVFFEYPMAGEWTLGFVTGDAPPALDDKVAPGVTIFLPTSPNPVTGFLIIVPEHRIVRVPMSVEEGFTFILSVGAVAPRGRASGPSPAPPPAPPPTPPSGPPEGGAGLP
jgi:uncharacterized membrane protein